MSANYSNLFSFKFVLQCENVVCLGCCRNGVQPDEGLFATLMLVAGKAKQVDLAFSLKEEMEAEGLKSGKVA